MAMMTHHPAACTDGGHQPDTRRCAAPPARGHAPDRWCSPPWDDLVLGRTDGWVGIARHLRSQRSQDCYWCGDAHPAGFCSCPSSIWLDGDKHPSRIAVYHRRRDVIIAWQTYQQERMAAGLPALTAAIEPRRLASIRDWTTVPARLQQLRAVS